MPAVADTINRWDALAEIDKGHPFDLVFSTADRKRGTGGEIKEVKKWVKFKGDEVPENVPGQLRKDINRVTNPQHSKWKTFNIYQPNRPAIHPYKVHWRLMHFFNGKRIIG